MKIATSRSDVKNPIGKLSQGFQRGYHVIHEWCGNVENEETSRVKHMTREMY